MGTNAPENRLRRTLLILPRKKELRSHITVEPNKNWYRKLMAVPIHSKQKYKTRLAGPILIRKPNRSMATATDGRTA